MSLKLNIAANYVSQLYVSLIGILLIPVYLSVMGHEAYGLVALFAVLQSWLQLLDFGLTATMSREAARYLGGAHNAATFRQLLRSMEGAFCTVALLIAVTLVAASPGVASHWLNVRALPSGVVVTSLSLIACTLALRSVSGLYRGVVVGLERQVWLSAFNIAIVSLRFAGVIPFLYFVDPGPVVFFTFQLAVSAFELVALIMFCYRRVALPAGARLSWSWAPLRPVLAFSATLAFTSVVWVLVTQTDKLLLSKLLPLDQYGLFSAAVLLASGISLLGVPVAQALLPRLCRLSQQGDDAALVQTYRRATQATTAVAGTAALIAGVFAEQILWVWTGDRGFAADYARVFGLYAVGNGFLALAAFPYYLQYAKGDLKLHCWGNIVFVCLLVPAIVLATMRFGVLGAGAVWAGTNLLFFLLWTPLVHRRFFPRLHGVWLVQDVLRVLMLPVLLGLVLLMTQHLEMNRFAWAVLIALAALAVMGSALLRCLLLRPQLQGMLASFSPLRL
jgi:O-antigen/teichoic acid export membrane protein